MTSAPAMSKFLSPRRIRIQSENIKAAAMWGVAAGTTALWIVQPFDWIKKTFFEKPAEEK